MNGFINDDEYEKKNLNFEKAVELIKDELPRMEKVVETFYRSVGAGEITKTISLGGPTPITTTTTPTPGDAPITPTISIK